MLIILDRRLLDLENKYLVSISENKILREHIKKKN